MTNRLSKVLSLPKRYSAFWRDWRDFGAETKGLGDERFDVNWDDRLASLWENSDSTAFDAHYVYHTAWAVRQVTQLQPAKHIDISSTLYFCATLSATVPVDFFDYRPAPLKLSNLTCGRQDLTQLTFEDDSIESLSCMHTIEHVGLGRYGDALDPVGDLKAAAELKRVVSPGGTLIMVVPVGSPKLCFNSHRIYSHEQVLEMFQGFELISTALVKDDRSFLTEPSTSEINAQSYGCGCYVFRKKT